MSTGLECWIMHLAAQPGSGWYYFLEGYPIYGPDGGDMDVWGPFPTFDAAVQHLDANHANPGGWWSDPEDAPPRIPTVGEKRWLDSNYRGLQRG